MKIVTGVICLIAAAAIFWHNSSGGSSVPDTPDSGTAWMCHSCKHFFTLTAAQAADEAVRAEGPMPLFCPACSEKQAYRVAQCDQCEAYYFSRDVPGSLGRCEACFPAKGNDESEERERPRDDSPPSL